MSFIAFGTTANQQVAVSTSVIVLDTQFSSDSKIDELRNADIVIVRVNNGEPIRYLVDGGVPTSTHGNITSSGFSVSGSHIDKIKVIKDSGATGNPEILVTLGTNVGGFDQILNI